MHYSGWWIVCFVLLIATGLTVPRLNYDALSEDELNSVIAAGGAHYNTILFPWGVIRRTNERSPDQALGFPLIARVWGNFVGWEAFSLRVLPMLAGLVTIALTYRIGYDLFTPFVGVAAAGTLATSVYYITYMHKFRTFTLASLCIAAALWCYWRIALSHCSAGWFAYIAFIVAGIGIKYLHYFVVPLVIALAAFHVLFVPKDARWWRTVAAFAVIMVAFIPQVAFLIEGLVFNAVENADLRDRALSPTGVVMQLAYFFGNGIPAIFVILVGMMLWAFYRLPANHVSARYRIGWLGFISLLMLLGIITINEIAGVMVPHRVRYLFGLWVPLALLGGVGFWKLSTVNRRLGYGGLLLWLSFGVLVSADGTLMVFDGGDDGRIPAWQGITDVVLENGEPQDGFVYLGGFDETLGHYTHTIANRHFIHVYHGEPEMQAALVGRIRVWVVQNHPYKQPDNITSFYNLLNAHGYTRCDTYWTDTDFDLHLYAHSPALCPGGQPIINFGDQLTLTQLEQYEQQDQLIVNTNWRLSAKTPPYTYAIGFYIFSEAGTVVSQQDISLDGADGPYFPAQARLELGELPVGNFTLQVAVYNWRNGARLPGVAPGGSAPISENLIPIGSFDR